MSEPKKLIEVAMPIKEISAASVHDKYIHHGHISTLHIWWARRPLPVCRAVIFASLVPDPLDPHCPKIFCDAVEDLLGHSGNIGDPYKPYLDIPYTAAIDPMPDTNRNRLLMFIGKFSQQYIQDQKHGKPTALKDQFSDYSLIKWENRNNNKIIDKAIKLIYTAYNSKRYESYSNLSIDFDSQINEIRKIENQLYNEIDRDINSSSKIISQKLAESIKSFQEKMPIVFDPFAGGGAIPLEAARLGCRSYGNDINPVAHIIQKGSLEFPQRFGKKIIYSKDRFLNKYGLETLINFCRSNSLHIDSDNLKLEIENVLAFDVEFYAKNILERTKSKIDFIYPADKDGKVPTVYYWVKIGKCANPTCSAEVPLLKQFYIANSTRNKIYLSPIIKENKIDFELKRGITSIDGWLKRGNLECPCCGNITSIKILKEQFKKGQTTERLLVVIFDGANGKEYRLPTDKELESINLLPENIEIPFEQMPVEYTQAMPSCTWGINKWGDLFSKRQLFAIHGIIESFNELKKEVDANKDEYSKAIFTYLALWIDRTISYMTSFGRWIPQNEQLSSLFGRQAIPMVFDYPEVSVFSPTTSGAINQLEWVLMYLNSENKSPFVSICNNASSGEKEQFKHKEITAVVTDPPYYDAIAYADLSDFFYVWLKRTIGDLYPINFATPQTPKSDECTMLKHHHQGNATNAKKHFENKLLSIFDSIEHQTSDIVSIMFAHQSTEAWSTLCSAILGARMNITGSWAIDSERENRMVANSGAALQSSVTVSCKPSVRKGVGGYKDVKNAINEKVAIEVEKLYKLGFRGADLITACFGQAVSEFGKFENVEKADGSDVSVSDLLEIARESAFNSLLKNFTGDEFTKFYIGWLQLNGLVDTDFDDAAKFTKVGLTLNVQDLFKENILIKNGNNQHLGVLKERLNLNSKLGEGKNIAMIDLAHKLMALYGSTNRNNLLKYIEINSFETESPVWRVITSLAELLPKDIEDHKLAIGLLTNKDQLIREAKSSTTTKPEQSKLILE